MKQYNILGGIDNLTEKQKMITREEYLKALQLIYEYKEQVYNDVQNQIDVLNVINPNDMVKDNISMKLRSILKAVEWDYDVKVKDFKPDFTIKEIKQCRGMGKKTLKELTDFCNKIDIKLK